MRIQFVCLGNICRSPTAEGVFRHLATGRGFTVGSAGTSDWHVGEAPYGPMQAAALARGYDLGDLRAQHFKALDFSNYDLIIAMDADNQKEIESQRPAGNKTPVRLFTDYAQDSDADHVPDPYYTRDFDGTLTIIEIAARGLLRSVN